MRVIAGTFNGVGSAVNIGLGFIPDFVRVRNNESTSTEMIEWSRHMRAAETLEGVWWGADGAQTELTVGAGVAIYRGGETAASGNTTKLKKLDSRDQRGANVVNGHAAITTWTLGSSANKTGSVNDELNTTRVGEGSVIVIRESASGRIKEAVITALTSNGEQANEVTLSEAVGSGDILFIGPMYDYEACAAGEVTKAGFTINETANINVSGEMCYFEAGTYDD
jgi:hypothetical protein